jgi:hypothetical protein
MHHNCAELYKLYRERFPGIVRPYPAFYQKVVNMLEKDGKSLEFWAEKDETLLIQTLQTIPSPHHPWEEAAIKMNEHYPGNPFTAMACKRRFNRFISEQLQEGHVKTWLRKNRLEQYEDLAMEAARYVLNQHFKSKHDVELLVDSLTPEQVEELERLTHRRKEEEYRSQLSAK